MTRRRALALTLADLGPALRRCGVRVAAGVGVIVLFLWRIMW